MISKKGVTFGTALVLRPLQLRGCAQYSGPASVSWQARPGCRWRAFDLFWAAGLRAHGARVPAGGSQAPAFIWFRTRGRASERSTCLRDAAGCAPAAPHGSDPLIIAAAAARAGPSRLAGTGWAWGKAGGAAAISGLRRPGAPPHCPTWAWWARGEGAVPAGSARWAARPRKSSRISQSGRGVRLGLRWKPSAAKKGASSPFLPLG